MIRNQKVSVEISAENKGRLREKQGTKRSKNTYKHNKNGRICPSYEQLNVNGLNSPVKTHRVKE